MCTLPTVARYVQFTSEEWYDTFRFQATLCFIEWRMVSPGIAPKQKVPTLGNSCNELERCIRRRHSGERQQHFWQSSRVYRLYMPRTSTTNTNSTSVPRVEKAQEGRRGQPAHLFFHPASSGYSVGLDRASTPAPVLSYPTPDGKSS